MKATGEFSVTSWQQLDLGGVWAGKPLMKIDAVFEASGEISGSILVAYLMYYSHKDGVFDHDGKAGYTGYLAFNGKLADKEGTFFLQDCGVYENSAPFSDLTIVTGSGEGDFAGIEGEGKYFARDGKMIIELKYSFAEEI